MQDWTGRDLNELLVEGGLARIYGVRTPLPDGRVRQHFVESADEGKTWTEWFDGYYSRR